MNRRGERFQQFNANTAHQRLAGIASWCAFSARWRAHQGLPLFHPMDVQFLTPQDFCNGLGRPLHPTKKRRGFWAYCGAGFSLSLGGGGGGGGGGPRLSRGGGWVLCAGGGW